MRAYIFVFCTIIFLLNRLFLWSVDTNIPICPSGPPPNVKLLTVLKMAAGYTSGNLGISNAICKNGAKPLIVLPAPPNFRFVLQFVFLHSLKYHDDKLYVFLYSSDNSLVFRILIISYVATTLYCFYKFMKLRCSKRAVSVSASQRTLALGAVYIIPLCRHKI